MVPSPQVEPFHLREKFSEFLFKCPGGTLQRFEQLFAEGVEVQPFDAV